MVQSSEGCCRSLVRTAGYFGSESCRVLTMGWTHCEKTQSSGSSFDVKTNLQQDPDGFVSCQLSSWGRCFVGHLT